MIEDLYRRAIEKTYTDLCTVTEFEKFTKGNKTTAFRENVKYSDIPCRLSLESKNAAAGTGTVTNISQSVMLFVSPDVEIKAGSKITVKHDGVSTDYKQSGFPAVFKTHREIPLELFDERA